MINVKESPLSAQSNLRKPVVFACLLVLPFLFFLFFFLVIQKNPLNFRLAFSDELDYWVEAATLSKRGLFSPNAGYFGYSFGNYARFLYFGAHGFFSLIPYALFGLVAPRTQAVVLVLNALFMGIGFTSAYYLLGSFRKTLAIALPLFAFYPFYLYYQTGMVETLNYAVSVFLAVLCVKCFFSEPRQRGYLNLYFWLVIVFSLFRLSNFVLIIPALSLEIYLNKQKIFYTILKYGVAAVSVALLSIVFAATYPWGFLGELGKSKGLLDLVFTNTLTNIKLFFDLKAGYALELLPRFLYLSWLIFLCINYIATKRHNTKVVNYFQFSQILALLALLLLNITLYDIGSFRDLRVFSPILVFSMIAFFLSGQGKNSGKWALSLALIFLLASNFVVFKERNLAWDLFIAKRYEATSPSFILKDVRYNPDAKTRWENSVYVDLQAYGELDWQNYDPGIGLMVLSQEEIDSLKSANPGSLLKAKYLISSQPGNIAGYDMISEISHLSLYIKED